MKLASADSPIDAACTSPEQNLVLAGTISTQERGRHTPSTPTANSSTLKRLHWTVMVNRIPGILFILLTYFQVWVQKIVNCTDEVVVVGGRSDPFPKVHHHSWDNTIPWAVPWLCSRVLLSLDSGSKCLQASSEFSASTFMFWLCVCLFFLVFQKQSIPTASSNKDSETYTTAPPTWHFLLIFLEHSHLPPVTSRPTKISLRCVKVASFPSIFQSSKYSYMMLFSMA